MSLYLDTPTASVLAAAALSQFVRVKVTAVSTGSNPMTVDVAAATDQAVGYVQEGGIANGAIGSIRLIGRPVKAVASKSFAVGAALYGAASGKVTDTKPADGKLIGVAGTASGGDGSIVTVFQVDSRDHT
jgi:hypothetical protein